MQSLEICYLHVRTQLICYSGCICTQDKGRPRLIPARLRLIDSLGGRRLASRIRGAEPAKSASNCSDVGASSACETAAGRLVPGCALPPGRLPETGTRLPPAMTTNQSGAASMGLHLSRLVWLDPSTLSSGCRPAGTAPPPCWWIIHGPQPRAWLLILGPAFPNRLDRPGRLNSLPKLDWIL